MGSALYSVRSGFLETGLFMNGSPAFFRPNRYAADTRSVPVYDYFDVIGYTLSTGVEGQYGSLRRVVGEAALIAEIEQRLKLDQGALAGIMARCESHRADEGVQDAMIRIAARRPLRPVDLEAVRSSQWNYLEF